MTHAIVSNGEKTQAFDDIIQAINEANYNETMDEMIEQLLNDENDHRRGRADVLLQWALHPLLGHHLLQRELLQRIICAESAHIANC